MKIHHIELQNFRRYPHARFQFHPRFTVLIGNNGSGKTTVLDALAMLLNTYFQGAGLPTGGGTIKAGDARAVLVRKGGQVFKESMDEVALEASATHGTQAVTWRRELGDRGGQAKTLVQMGTQGRAALKKGGSPDLPLLLYYGAGRLWSLHDSVETSQPSSQLNAYRYCLDPKSDQKAFEKWFKTLTLADLQKGRKVSPAVQAVKAAVLACIPGARDFFYDTELDDITIELRKEGLVPFSSLSDGYRNMVAMVADIAHRASRLNPHHAEQAPRKTQGVVLIDEIDLHLHPKWQRKVVADLKKAFPGLQFIATTHSPFIVQSLRPGEVIDLDQAPQSVAADFPRAGLAAPGPGSPFSNRSIEDIVEAVMGVDLPQRSERLQEMYDAAKAYYTALKAPRPKGASLDALKRKLDALSAPFSEEVAYHAFLEMERLAAGLGSSRKRRRSR